MHLKASPHVVRCIHPDVIVSHDVGFTHAIVFEKAHEQDQRFVQVVECLGQEVDGVIAIGFAGTGHEGPNVLDIIDTHQCGGVLVEVGLDLQIGDGQCCVISQAAIHQIVAKGMQFGVGGEVLIIGAQQVLVQLPVMIFPSRQGRHDDQTQLLNQVLQHLADMSELLVARQLNRPLDYGWLTRLLTSHLTMKIGGQFQHGIAEGVRVVHTEQGHLRVG